MQQSAQLDERPKKPAGWYSVAAKAERRLKREWRKRTRQLEKSLGVRRRELGEKTRSDAMALVDAIEPKIILGTAVQRHAELRQKEQQTPTNARAKKFRTESKRMEDRTFLSATPERMAKVNEPFSSIKSVDDHGKTIETQELGDWPLSRLYKSGALGRDPDIAKKRHDAGEDYYKHWFHAKLFPLGSRDYRKPYTGANLDPYSIAPSQERAEHHRQKWREAEKLLNLGQIVPDRVSRATHYIVIDEMEPAKVGRIITARKHEQQARAVAIEYLIDGLDRLRRT